MPSTSASVSGPLPSISTTITLFTLDHSILPPGYHLLYGFFQSFIILFFLFDYLNQDPEAEAVKSDYFLLIFIYDLI